MASGAVDPFRLTPAQTLDNTNNNHNNIPSIPQAPLHMIYKSLQQKLENLERHHLHSTEVKQALNRVQQIIHMTGNSSTAHLPTTLTTTTTITTTTLLAFPPVLIAYQLTLIDSAIFRNIQPSALLNHHAPKSPHPAIVASTDFFNYLTRIIEHMILTPSEASGRAEQINFWIKVAIKCHDLKNFQTLKAIISALGTPPIQRLKRSWAYVPKKSMARLDVVNEIMTEHNNYERYRDRITRIVQQTSREPVIPFLGVFMHDVTYITSIPVASSSSSSAPATSLSSSLPTTSTNTCNNNKQVTKLDDQLTLFTNLHKHPPYSSALPPFCVKDFNKKQQQRKPFANESLELQQCLVTHYLLTRSWVSEKTVDELSLLRETPKVMRSCSAIDHSMTYDGGSWSSSGSFLSYIGTHSMVSSSSSSRPISLESDDDDNDSDVESNKQNNNININSKFWVFGRKSVDHQHHQQHKKPSLQIDHHHHAIPMLPAVAPKHLRRERLSRHFSFEDLDVRKKQHQQPVSSQSQQQQQGLSIFRKDFTFWRKEQDVPSTEPSSPQHPLDFDPMYKRNSVTLLERPIAS
ncbi:ras guanine nucleotide exchange factor domain-containing protein [Phascolomyces articulosus]|uniref:Ras guanine nucleotide exchange factor domain-containing protein n=1 Tax=Phascolomyces articulosus TaxID=60185 RepID=A0AAD5JKS1_9FUNG|nr:ras guanine nucleotide exchange factor domain-containing protein [Phascolomyces articulosus]